jgi:GNAT superfamily N-acetyltransferase
VSDVIRIRAADPREGERLREIAVYSKCHWGYERGSVERWVAQGDFSLAGLRGKEVFVAEDRGEVVAWAALVPRGEVGWLDDLWVEPRSMGRGIGTRLFRRARERARELGARRLEWEAEPHAVGFYESLGGRYVRDGHVEWGLVAPVMGLDLT